MRYQDREVPISRVKRLRKVTSSHFYIVETYENGRIVVRRTSEWFLSPNLCPSLTFFYSAIVSAHLQNSRLLPPHFLKIPNPDLASRKGGRYSQFTHFSPFRVTLLLNLPGRFASSPFHPDWNPRFAAKVRFSYLTGTYLFSRATQTGHATVVFLEDISTPCSSDFMSLKFELAL